MKTRITRNEVKNLAPRRIAVGYCELQHLLRHTPCTHYNAGVYGWNFDVYIVYGAAGNPKPDNYCLIQEYYNDIKDDLTIIRGNIGFREHKSQLYRESVEILTNMYDAAQDNEAFDVHEFVSDRVYQQKL